MGVTFSESPLRGQLESCGVSAHRRLGGGTAAATAGGGGGGDFESCNEEWYLAEGDEDAEPAAEGNNVYVVLLLLLLLLLRDKLRGLSFTSPRLAIKPFRESFSTESTRERRCCCESVRRARPRARVKEGAKDGGRSSTF